MSIDRARLARAMTWATRSAEAEVSQLPNPPAYLVDTQRTGAEVGGLQLDLTVWVEENGHPEEGCGTTACLAGWVVLDAYPGARVTGPDGYTVSHPELGKDTVPDTASDLLGLSPSQGLRLFHADDLGHLLRIADQLLEEDGQPILTGSWDYAEDRYR